MRAGDGNSSPPAVMHSFSPGEMFLELERLILLQCTGKLLFGKMRMMVVNGPFGLSIVITFLPCVTKGDMGGD